MKRIRKRTLRRLRLVQRAVLSVTFAACFGGAASAQSPYATTLAAENAAYGGASLYNDPNAILGEPTRIAQNNDPIIGSTPFHVKIVEPAYNRDTSGNKVLTTLARRNDGGNFTYGSITVKFDHAVTDDPTNPYGIDLNVFGNAFYVGGGTEGGYVSDTTDMRSYYLSGGIFAEPVVISVSPDNVNWFTYGDGPFGDTAFPTQGTAWDAIAHDQTGSGWTGALTDFTKPVNPTLDEVLGQTGTQTFAADAMSMYVGSGGGTGIDLAPSGFDWIQYVRVEATAQFRDGEIDAFADVRPMQTGDALSITPLNVDLGTKLFFQQPADLTQSAIIADFSMVADFAKLKTGAVVDEDALLALAHHNSVATYQLDVSTLVGDSSVAYLADFALQPGLEYQGDGSDLQLMRWIGNVWAPQESSFDAVAGHLLLEDWDEASTTLAVIQTVTDAFGDFDSNGQVDGADFLLWQREFGKPGFDAASLDQWKANYGASSSIVTSAVPEPASAVLAGIVLAVASARRRCR